MPSCAAGIRPRSSLTSSPGPVVALARGVEQLAGVPVRPAVVRAAQERGVAAVGAADAHAAMAARVQEDADDPFVVAEQDRRVEPARPRDEVARLLDLALVPDEEPGATEDPLDLELEDLGVGEDPPRDEPLLRAARSPRGTRRSGAGGGWTPRPLPRSQTTVFTRRRRVEERWRRPRSVRLSFAVRHPPRM